MKTPPVSLLLGVSVLLLSALTVSSVSLNVSQNLQQFFSGDSVSLSCVEDGHTVDGRTVKRSAGGQIVECGAAGSDFGKVDGSSCVLDLTKDFTVDYLCETSSGQRSDPVTITVTGKGVILEIPALPVVTGSDVTLRCRDRKSGTVEAYFYIKGKKLNGKAISVNFTISKVQQSDEGPYSCGTDEDGKSPESRLRVRDSPTTSDPHTTTSSKTSHSHATTTPYTATTCNKTDAATTSSSLLMIPVLTVLGALVVLVLVVVVVLQLWRKQKARKDSSHPVDVTYADVTIRQAANRRGPAEVTYGQVMIKNQRKAGRKTEQPPDPDVLYSSVRAGK